LLLNPIPLLVLALCVSPRLAALALAGIAAKCAADAMLFRKLTGKLPSAGHVLLVPAKDLLLAAIWVVGAFKLTVNWRGNLFSIERGSRLVPLDASFATAVEEVA